MTNPVEAVYVDDVVKMEQPGRYSREKLTIKVNAGASAGLVVGEVLESDTGYKAVATGANAAAILLEPVDLVTLKAGTCERVCLVRGPAIVDSDRLTCASNQKVAALVALKVLHILAVTEPVKYEEGLAS